LALPLLGVTRAQRLKTRSRLAHEIFAVLVRVLPEEARLTTQLG
jgi:hypothetical protein